MDPPALQATWRIGNWNYTALVRKEPAQGGNVNVTIRKRLDNLSISTVGKGNFIILAIDLSITYLKWKHNYYSKVLIY